MLWGVLAPILVHNTFIYYILVTFIVLTNLVTAVQALLLVSTRSETPLATAIELAFYKHSSHGSASILAIRNVKPTFSLTVTAFGRAA